MTNDSSNKGKFARRYLGEILVEFGTISPEQLDQALLTSKREEKKIGQILIEMGAVDDADIAQAIAEQLSIPYIELMYLEIPEDILKIIPEKVVIKHLVIPVSQDETSLTVVMANPLDADALEDVRFATSLRINIATSPENEVLHAIAKYFSEGDLLESPFMADGDKQHELTVYSTQKKEEEEKDNNDLLNLSDKPPIVKFTNVILGDAIKVNASDIHIEPRSKSVVIRYRIDGVMKEIMKTEKHIHSGIVTRIKVLASMDISIRRAPQDGKFQVHYGRNKIDFRVSTLPTAYGEKVTMRVLNAVGAPDSIEEIDLSTQSLKLLNEAISRPKGIVLVTGPTGSGKTTTLYSCLKTLMSPEVNIITLENPIEYELEGISQVEINPKQGLTFAGGLRSVLRQDPDIVLLGEIRDQETATIAFHAAQTGHLVLSTLHTNSALATISRLQDLGIEPYAISNSLNAVISQRLVRRLCSKCKEKVQLSDDEKQSLPKAFRTEKTVFVYRENGCEHCDASGFSGRIAIHEIFPVTPGVQALLAEKQSVSELEREADKYGFINMNADGVQKALQGLTTLSEVYRVAPIIEDEPVSTDIAVTNTAVPTESESKTQTEALAETEKNVNVNTAKSELLKVNEEADMSVSEKPKAAKKKSVKILVIDDVATIIFLLQGVLEGEGHSIITAENGVQGLELAQKELPDLIITDYQMPEMDGFEMIRNLREGAATSFIPIIMLTADDDVDTEIEVLNSGADDFLVKPVNTRKLIARVNVLLKKNLSA